MTSVTFSYVSLPYPVLPSFNSQTPSPDAVYQQVRSSSACTFIHHEIPPLDLIQTKRISPSTDEPKIPHTNPCTNIVRDPFGVMTQSIATVASSKQCQSRFLSSAAVDDGIGLNSLEYSNPKNSYPLQNCAHLSGVRKPFHFLATSVLSNG